MDSLRKLPPDAAYEKKSGQANLKLSYNNGNIQASASCDSLQYLVYTYEETIDRLMKENAELQEQVKPPEFTLKCYLTGVLTGILTILIFQFIRKWQNIF